MRNLRKGTSTRGDATSERSSTRDTYRTVLGGRRMITVTVGTFTNRYRRSRKMAALMVARTQVTVS